MNVPNGFILTTDAYNQDVGQIKLPTMDVTDITVLNKITTEIQQRIINKSITEDIAAEVIEAYSQLNNLAVAVRSSATTEDLPGASFAGQQETFLHVNGEGAVLQAIGKCWASLWTARAVQYRHLRGFNNSNVAIAVVIQVMAPHQVSGVVFTVNPLSGNPNELLINAVAGAGEKLVQGEVTPDQWVARRPDGAVISFTTARQNQFHARLNVRGCTSTSGCLFSSQIRELSSIALRIEKHFGGIPQDIEWCYGRGNFYILQSRPITTLGTRGQANCP